MKTFLFATAAVVALASITATAEASDFDLTIGGKATFEAGISDDDRNAKDERYDFRNEVEIDVNAVAVDASGMEYGMFATMSNANDPLGTNWDSSFRAKRHGVFLKSDLGELRLGDDYGAAYHHSVFAPTLGADTMIDGSFHRYTGRHPAFQLGPHRGLNSDTLTKASYFTPSFHGFSAGASFVPTIDKGDRISLEKEHLFKNGIEVGAGYDAKINDVHVKAGATLLKADVGKKLEKVGGEDILGWSAGAQVGLKGIRIGGGYSDHDQMGVEEGPEIYSYNIGAAYAFDEFEVGATWARTTANADEKEHNDSYILGASYNVAPGLKVGAEAVRFSDEIHTGGEKEKGYVGLIRTQLSF